MTSIGNIFSMLLGGAVLCACTPTKPATTAASKHESTDLVGKPSDINARLCKEYIKEQNYQVAMHKCEKAVAQDPNNSAAYAWKAILHQKLGQDKLALQHFERAVALDPKDSTIRNNFGAFLCQQKKIVEAERELQLAIADPLYESRDLAYANLGVCLTATNKAKAETAFQSALELNAGLPVALIHMAELKYEQAQYLPARVLVNRWRDASPWTAKALWLAIRIESKLDNKDKVASYGLVLQARFPESDETKFYSLNAH